jgi:hypothetical protein
MARAKTSSAKRSRQGKHKRATGSRAKAGRSARGASSARPDAHEDMSGGPFGASITRILDLQRKVMRAGSAAARSAVDNPASKLVKDGVSESLQGGLRKLEHVFDERVAAALERLGMPSAEDLRDLLAKVEALTKTRRRK